MTSTLLSVADAVVKEINTQQWSLDFAATRQNIPRFQLEKLDQLCVTVTPKDRVTEKVSRGITQDVITLSIAVRKKLGYVDTFDENSESDELIELCESIQGYFDQGKRLASMPSTTCEETAFGSSQDSPWYSVEDQNNARVYTGIVVLTFRVYR